MACHHAGLDDEQTRDVIAAMSRREVQPDEVIIRSSTCPIALSKQQQHSLGHLAKADASFQASATRQLLQTAALLSGGVPQQVLGMTGCCMLQGGRGR